MSRETQFDTAIQRIGTHSSKWDDMEKLFGVSPQSGLAMWVADMDFRAPACVTAALERMTALGVYGYYGDEADYHAAICYWMATRHGWAIDPAEIFSTHGLVNGTSTCVETFTAPGDGVVLFTPVYHAFARIIRTAGREVVECPLVNADGRYVPDFDAYDAMITGREKMMILCSPHNPGGRVWTRAELEGYADFAKRHDLILVSDEIHHDLVFDGARHIPMTKIDGIEDRLVMMTAASKTFNIAGGHVGNVIIKDPELRAKFARKHASFGKGVNAFGIEMVRAAYSAEGAAWTDDLMAYLSENRRIFDEGIASIPGLKSMPLEATYLAWVDMSGTGLTAADYQARISRDAQIAASFGETFGKGGETFMRFNFATQRANVVEAVARLQRAFGDLQ